MVTDVWFAPLGVETNPMAATRTAAKRTRKMRPPAMTGVWRVEHWLND
jgi:hypothetical protein